jgi:hypothetical protein
MKKAIKNKTILVEIQLIKMNKLKQARRTQHINHFIK